MNIRSTDKTTLIRTISFLGSIDVRSNTAFTTSFVPEPLPTSPFLNYILDSRIKERHLPLAPGTTLLKELKAGNKKVNKAILQLALTIVRRGYC